MQQTNSELRKRARQVLDGKWGTSAVATLIYVAITGGGGTTIDFLYRNSPYINIFWTIICFPLFWGFSIYFLSIFREEETSLSSLFKGFNDFSRIMFTMLLQFIYIFLWSLLLIIPGIIKALSYSMTPYILKDNPEMKYNAAIEESMRLMQGHKLKLLLLYLSFIGWGLLCMLTLGLGLLLLEPYMQTSVAAFYQDLINEDLTEKAGGEQTETFAEITE